MKITENTVEIGSLTWFYREITPVNPSSQPPVVLLHGIPAQGLTWCELMTPLADKGFRAIAPDWIGSGFSSKPEKQDFAYTTEAYLQALEDFLKTLALDKISLVVQGFLATVGIQYALKYPDNIDRLIILNSPLTTTAKLPWQMKQWGIPLVGDMLTQDPLLIDRTIEGGSGFVIADEKLDIYRKPFLKTSASGRALMNTVKQLNLSKNLVEIETGLQTFPKPILIIWGELDPWLEASPIEDLVKTNPNVELVKIPEAKHYPQVHFPQEVSDNMLPFLRRQLNIQV